MKYMLGGLVILTGLAIPQFGEAAGNLAGKPTALDPLVMDKAFGFAPKEYSVETGKYYKWHIDSKGGQAFTLRAPELFQHIWVEKIVTESLVFSPDTLKAVTFDKEDEGQVDIFFVPISPGDFDFFAAGFEAKGMSGKFHVR